MNERKIEVPFDDDTKHPIAVTVGHNPIMGCFEVCLLAGNFETEEAASNYARIVAEFLRNEAEGEILAVQREC